MREWYNMRENLMRILSPEGFDLEKTKSKTNGGVLRFAVAVMLFLVLIGRGISYFYTVAANDIAFASWVSSALSYISEIIVCARTVAAIAVIVFAVYYNCGKGRFFVSAAACAFVDYLARFFIDLVTNAISGAELLAACWLLMQFLFELLLFALSLFIAETMRKKQNSAKTVRQTEKYTVNRACTASVLAVGVSKLILEVWYLVDFMLAYTDITSTETASIVGSFLKIIVIYGGVAALFGELYTELLKKRATRKSDVRTV